MIGRPLSVVGHLFIRPEQSPGVILRSRWNVGNCHMLRNQLKQQVRFGKLKHGPTLVRPIKRLGHGRTRLGARVAISVRDQTRRPTAISKNLP